MPRPLISEFFNHSQLSSASKCDITFEQYSTCQFEIRVKRVYKDGVNALPNGLYGRQTAEKQHSWPPRLSGIFFELKRGRARTYENENEKQLWVLLENLCKKVL